MTNDQRRKQISKVYESNRDLIKRTWKFIGRDKEVYCFWKLKLTDEYVYISDVTGVVWYDDDQGFEEAVDSSIEECDELLESLDHQGS